MPGKLQEIIARRLGRLGEQARSLAEVVAVIGPTFDVELIRKVSGWDEGTVLDALEASMDRHLIQSGGGVAALITPLCTSSSKIQSKAIPEGTRKRRHRRIAQVMGELYPQRLDELSAKLAQHFDLGGRYADETQLEKPDPLTRVQAPVVTG